MALFERPTASHFTALLRLGFKARLRSETAHNFVTRQSTSPSSTNHRQTASVFFFHSGQASHPSIAANSIHTLVLPCCPDEHTKTFLTLAQIPSFTPSPNLLELHLAEAPNPNRVLFSLSTISNPRKYLSLHGVQSGKPLCVRDLCTKWELFHLEIFPATIGKPITEPLSKLSNSYLSVSQTITHAFLQLGIRFRLRSTHSRVLQRATEHESCTTISQAHLKTDIKSNTNTDLILTASNLTHETSSSASLLLALKDTFTNRYLTLSAENEHASCASLPTDTSAPPLLIINLFESWGHMAIGVVKEPNFKSLDWLMAGPRGKLELRAKAGTWEMFQMEFVQQSYNVAIQRLPVPKLYALAEEATRMAIRSEIAAKVAMARAITGDSSKPSKVKKSAFNHAAALGALSAEDEEKRKRTAVASKESKPKSSSKTDVKDKTPDSMSKKNKATAQKAAAVAAASGLPRNKASRKANRKNKKRAKAAKKSSLPRESPSPSSSATPEPEEDLGTEQKSTEPESKKSDKKEEGSSSSSSPAPSPQHGPKCAACGHAMTGTYTTAMGKEFHPQCFCCGMCRRPMVTGAGQFRERQGVPYCQSCYGSHIASRCARCSKPIMDSVITAMDKTWHQDCLTCILCRLPLTQTFWLYADKPNEPRCSRCVTGDENASTRRGSSRMVNLPGFGPKANRSSPPFPTMAPGSQAGSSQPGRARLLAPTWPSAAR